MPRRASRFKENGMFLITIAVGMVSVEASPIESTGEIAVGVLGGEGGAELGADEGWESVCFLSNQVD